MRCNGDGDGSIGPVTLPQLLRWNELTYFWHLNAADLMTGINPASGFVWGGQFPAAKLMAGLHVGTLAGGAVPNSGLGIAAGSVMGGLYVALHNTPDGAVAALALLTLTRQRIDTKIDDGVPTSGNVFPAGAAWPVSLPVFTTKPSQGNNCNLYIRIQG